MTAFVTEARQLLAGFEWWALLLALWPLVALGTAGHALLTKRDARAAWGWLAVCWLFSLAGPELYYVFGVHRLRPHATRLPLEPSTPNIGSENSAAISQASSEHTHIPTMLYSITRTSHLPLTPTHTA